MEALALDTSGDWKYISVVVIYKRPNFHIPHHVASVRRSTRDKIIMEALNFISANGYAVCLLSDLRLKVRSLMRGNKEKSSVWRKALKGELLRAKYHLASKGIRIPNRIFVDKEFEPFIQVVKDVFRTPFVVSEKNEYTALADVVAYVNLRRRHLARLFRIVELH